MTSGMRAARSLTWLLLGLCGIGLISGSLFELSAPPKWFTIMAAIVTALTLIRVSGRRLRTWKRQRDAVQAFAESSSDNGLAMRLLGGYVPFSIEAAEQIGELRDRGAVPLLMFAIEGLMMEKPGGWREMASATVGALRRIGDRKPLPLLRRLQNMRGSDEIEGLTECIAEMEGASVLLRPAANERSTGETLVRPAGCDSQLDGPEILLRPASGVTNS